LFVVCTQIRTNLVQNARERSLYIYLSENIGLTMSTVSICINDLCVFVTEPNPGQFPPTNNLVSTDPFVYGTCTFNESGSNIRGRIDLRQLVSSVILSNLKSKPSEKSGLEGFYIAISHISLVY